MTTSETYTPEGAVELRIVAFCSLCGEQLESVLIISRQLLEMQSDPAEFKRQEVRNTVRELTSHHRQKCAGSELQ